MIDLYLNAPTRKALAADLSPLGLAVAGDLMAASHGHALIEMPPQPGRSGLTVAVRCMDDALAAALRGAVFVKGTRIVDRPADAPVFAGGEDADLGAAKLAACAAIDAEAERRRMLLLTPGEGQALEYQHTAEEAARAVAAADPLDPVAYPFLAAEQQALLATVGEVSLRDVALAVLTDKAAWLAYGAAIKAARRRAKLLIREAGDAAGVAEAAAGAAWPDLPTP